MDSTSFSRPSAAPSPILEPQTDSKAIPLPGSSWRVFKFGGASVKDAAAVRNAVHLVRAHGQAPLAVVVSAMAKTTNALETVVQALESGQTEQAVQTLAEIAQFHGAVVHDLELDGSGLLQELNSHWNALLQTPASSYAARYDAVVGGGDWASARILTEALQAAGVPAQWQDAQACIVTSNDHRRASVDFDATAQKLHHWPTNDVVVTQGFVGATADGTPTTLGREGSDYTAAVLAFCLEATEVTIWKDVPGVLSGDPRFFPHPTQLEVIPYREAIELAYYGASVIHPKTIQPLQAKGIALRVRSFLDSQAPGTVVRDAEKLIPRVPCFIRKANQVLVSVASRDLRFLAEKDLASLYRLFYEHGAEVNAVQHGATQSAFSLTFDPMVFPLLLDALRAVYQVSYNDGLTLFTVRHPDGDAQDWVRAQGEMLLEQSTRSTFQALLRTAK
jgi:aspartate kinase